jgi:hypothetical protein
MHHKMPHACRFCFLGDDDLLEILGQASNPEVIQAHLKKLYAGIHSVTLTEGAITHMHSIAGEKVPLVAGIIVSTAVESWLKQLTDGMKASLAASLTDALRSDAPNKWATQPAQTLSLTAELRFCMVRSGLRNRALRALMCREIRMLPLCDARCMFNPMHDVRT